MKKFIPLSTIVIIILLIGIGKLLKLSFVLLFWFVMMALIVILILRKKR